jgi:hypothetical protein
MPQIRPIAICIFSYNDKILVCEWHDPSKAETFYRPPGGAIEFGEFGPGKSILYPDGLLEMIAQ